MKKAVVNQGYEIIERKRAGETMVVVGYNPKAPQPYVTWKAYEHSDFTSFTHGNYFSTYKGAIIDFYKRLIDAWEYLPDQEKPPQFKKPRKKYPLTR